MLVFIKLVNFLYVCIAKANKPSVMWQMSWYIHIIIIIIITAKNVNFKSCHERILNFTNLCLHKTHFANIKTFMFLAKVYWQLSLFCFVLLLCIYVWMSFMKRMLFRSQLCFLHCLILSFHAISHYSIKYVCEQKIHKRTYVQTDIDGRK